MTDLNTPPLDHVLTLDRQGWVGLVDHMGTEVSVVNAARVSMGKRVDKLDFKDVKLLKYLLDNKHTSPFEHVIFSFAVKCPLFVRSQWFRHRSHSFSEVSYRYSEVDMGFYVPGEFRAQSKDNKQSSIKSSDIDQDVCMNHVKEAHAKAWNMYQELLNDGVCREQARGVLPVNTMTSFYDTVDLKNLMDFLDLRDHPHAQAEIREYAVGIKQLIAPYIPNLAKLKGW